MPATDPLPPVTDEHRRAAFALHAPKWPGVTFEQAMQVDIRRKLIEVCAHGIRTCEYQASQRDARTQRGRVGELTDAQIAAILASPLGILKEAKVHGVSPALIARMRRRNPALIAGTVWAGLGSRAGA